MADVLIQYTEPLTEHTGVMLSRSMLRQIMAEMKRDKGRYKVNNRASKAEVQRCALKVFFRLRDEHPELFQRLRDSG